MKPLFVDIGSFDGGEIRQAVADGYDVLAFEPNPNMSGPLEEFAGQALIVPAAAWDEDGFRPLYGRIEGDSSDMSCSLIREKSNVDKERFVTVPTVNTGKYLATLDREVTMLKIDCEGAEYRIIESILDHFDHRRIRNWYVEDHEQWILDEEWKRHKRDVLERVKRLGINIKPWINYGAW